MEQVQYLRTLEAIRERSKRVYDLALKGESKNFILNLEQLPKVVQFVNSLIKRDYNSIMDVPAHARWRHYDFDQEAGKEGRLDFLLNQKLEKEEITRQLFDLFVVSVLMDAGAGDKWQYFEEKTGKSIGRSEGLALAVLEMFQKGKFSSEKKEPFQVDPKALAKLTIQDLKDGFQVTDKNPLVGLDGRLGLLHRLGTALEQFPNYFSKEGKSRPGYLLDYLLQHPTTKKLANSRLQLKVDTFWSLLMDGFLPVWPASRTKLNHQPMGDVWPLESLKTAEDAPLFGYLVPFHKLSQWLAYSLMEPIQKLLQVEWLGLEKMTGLAEYRSGGLFVDFQVLTLKPEALKRGLNRNEKSEEPVPLFDVFDPVIVEWRALTLCLLDLVGKEICQIYKKSQQELPLVKVLEGGTWKAGREIAKQNRPKTKGPPIGIISDGTVF